MSTETFDDFIDRANWVLDEDGFPVKYSYIVEVFCQNFETLTGLADDFYWGTDPKEIAKNNPKNSSIIECYRVIEESEPLTDDEFDEAWVKATPTDDADRISKLEETYWAYVEYDQEIESFVELVKELPPISYDSGDEAEEDDEAPVDNDDLIKNHQIQLDAISSASMGYFIDEEDPNYKSANTHALKDVIDLYEKYESLYNVINNPPKHTTQTQIDYKYNEGNLLSELTSYVNATYSEHYSQAKIQATEVIMDSGHGLGFIVGDIIKYAMRYGKKDGYNRKDIMKILHYGLFLLNWHDNNVDGNKLKN